MKKSIILSLVLGLFASVKSEAGPVVQVVSRTGVELSPRAEYLGWREAHAYFRVGNQVVAWRAADLAPSMVAALRIGQRPVAPVVQLEVKPEPEKKAPPVVLVVQRPQFDAMEWYWRHCADSLASRKTFALEQLAAGW